MHELSIAAAIVDIASSHAGGGRVSAVHVRVGELRQVVPDSLAFALEHAARGTACEGAALELETVPARLECRSCGEVWALGAPAFRCPRCGSGDTRAASGGELEVASIEIEEEGACIASA